MSVENIQGNGSLMPFNKDANQTALELTKEAQATHELSMQVFQKMQRAETALAKQNTLLSVAIIACESRIQVAKMLFDGEIAALEEKKKAAEKTLEDIRGQLNVSLKQIDEKIVELKREEDAAKKILRQIKEEKIVSLKSVHAVQKKAVEQEICAEVVVMQAYWSKKIFEEKVRVQSVITKSHIKEAEHNKNNITNRISSTDELSIKRYRDQEVGVSEEYGYFRNLLQNLKGLLT
jgi:hypothetical protein